MGSIRAPLLLFLRLGVRETMKSLCGSSGTMAALQKNVLLGGGGL